MDLFDIVCVYIYIHDISTFISIQYLFMFCFYRSLFKHNKHCVDPNSANPYRQGRDDVDITAIP